MDDQNRPDGPRSSRSEPRRAWAVAGLAQSSEGGRRHARLVRRYRRQGAFAAALALTILLRQYVTSEAFEPWWERIQVTLAGVLVIDLLVRPVLRRIVPTRVIVQYGERTD
jgi:hypothetical protein